MGTGWAVGGWVSGRPHHYPPDPGSSLRQRHTLSPVSPERPLSAAEGGRWGTFRATSHRCGGSGARGPALPPRSPTPRMGPLPAHVSGRALTSQALRSRCRSPVCVLSARPSKRALGGVVTGGGGSWERGPQGANEYQEGRARMPGGRGGDRSRVRLWGPCLGGGRTRSRGGVAVGRDTDLSASGGSLQPARPRCRSVPARLRKSCSAAGAARDFLGWASGRSGLPGAGRRLPAGGSRQATPARTLPLTCGRRRSSRRPGG